MATDSPGWKTAKTAAACLPGKHGARFVINLIKNKKLRGLQLDGRGQYVTCDRWIDEYLESQAAPIVAPLRRHA